jgi:general secretion pathway protein E
MAVLRYQQGDDPAQTTVGDDPVTIGRQIGNVLTLDDHRVSRFHAVVEYRRGVLGVRDLGSRNGTRVNGEPVNKGKRLRDGDTLTVGSTHFKIDLNASGDEQAVGLQMVDADPADDADAEPPAQRLAALVGSLPARDVRPSDLQLLNARGKKALVRDDGQGQQSEAVTLLRLALLVCFRTGASDIHLEPKAEGYVLRVRVDGGMQDLAKLSKPIGVKFLTLIKVLSDIDIARSNIVQEGSFACRVPDRRVDYRVSLTPGLYGQKLVVRVLDAANAPQYLWDLGLGEADFELLDRLTRRNEGMVLVCGPTGSGKSSTLYAMLRSIDAKERNVVTIEDPVEIRLDGITQQPVNDAQGNTFAALLRSVLRQDPDVVLVGEIRDDETARTALQAAMTGHLVFSTVHSRDTVSAVFRLLDLGVEPYQVSSGLTAVLSQRLVRRLCPHCKKPRPASDADHKLTGRAFKTLYEAVGCGKCLDTGYAGRRAIFEVLHLDESVRDALMGNAEAGALHATLRGTGFRRLKDVALDLAEAGETTLDEADRVAG